MGELIRQLGLVTRLSFIRLIRQPASTVVTVGIPLVLIPIMGAVFTKIGSWDSYIDGAANPMAFFAIGIIVMFQLFGGRFSMDGVRDLLLSSRRWRIYAAPCEPGVVAIGVLAAGTLLNLLQGLLLVVFTRIALGVQWGNPGVILLVLFGTSLLAQLANVLIVLLVRNTGTSATLAWVFAWGSAAAGGLIVPLPSDIPFWHFMATYGTPYSLAQSAMVASASGSEGTTAGLCLAILFGLSLIAALLILLLGRRRIA